MSANGQGAAAARLSLGVITLKRGGDGVAYAGVLLERALTAIANVRPRVIALEPAVGSPLGVGARARFIGAVAIAQLQRPNGWLFNHVGVARAQNVLPPFIRKPYAVLLCGIEAWDPNLSPSRKKALNNASARIAISEYTAKRVNHAHPDIGDILVCPLALLPREDLSESVDSALLQRVRKTSVLIVGRMSALERYKGHDELLDCWPTVLRCVPAAQLVIVGKGDDCDRLRSKAASLGISEHVLFTGFVNDATLEMLRERTAVFALPSRGEGFGLVYLEAMRAGLACIGGSTDAAADVIVDGQTGILVNPSEPQQLAAAIVDLLTQPEMRAAYGAAGKMRFDAEFTFERYCERLRVTLESAFA